MSLFAKAAAGLNLTPAERAILKLVEGWLVAGFMAAVAAGMYELTQVSLSGAQLNWQNLILFVAGAFAVQTLMAGVKWARAQGDNPLLTPLADAAAGLATQIGNATGLNAAKVPLVEPSAASGSAVPGTAPASVPAAS